MLNDNQKNVLAYLAEQGKWVDPTDTTATEQEITDLTARGLIQRNYKNGSLRINKAKNFVEGNDYAVNFDEVQAFINAEFCETVRSRDIDGNDIYLTIAKGQGDDFATIEKDQDLLAYIKYVSDSRGPWIVDSDASAFLLSVIVLQKPDKFGYMKKLPKWGTTSDGIDLFDGRVEKRAFIKLAINTVITSVEPNLSTKPASIRNAERLAYIKGAISKTVKVGDKTFDIQKQPGSKEVDIFLDNLKVAEGYLKDAARISGSFSTAVRFLEKTLDWISQRKLTSALFDEMKAAGQPRRHSKTVSVNTSLRDNL